MTIPATIYGMPVTAIGNYAFFMDYVVTSVSIPDSVTTIGDYAFSACDILTSVTLGTNVASIGNFAFARSFSLASAAIPSSVTNIGGYPFGLCLSLSAITVDPANPAYSSVDGVLFDKSRSTLIEYPGGKVGALVIPASVATILDSAFYGCTNLNGVTIPNGVSSIGNWAFYSCTGLTNITLPGTVTNIGSSAFSECSDLTAITVDPANPSYASSNGVLFDKSQAILIQYPCGRTGDYTIPPSVTNIGPGAFKASGVTTVSIPNGLTSIGDFAFDGCTGLTNITIPDSVTNLGSDAFGGCGNLTSAVIGEGITNIGSYAFESCTSLASVYFKGNAPSIGAYAFADVVNCTVYYLPGTTGWGTVFGGPSLAPWLPRIQTTGSSFGVQSNQFGFSIVWTSGRTVVVESCTNFQNPVWSPLQTNALTSDSFYFNDAQSTNYSTRFYRVRSP